MARELFLSGKRLRIGLMMLAGVLLFSFGMISGDVFALSKEGGFEVVRTDSADPNSGFTYDGEQVIINTPGSYTISMKDKSETAQTSHEITIKSNTIKAGDEINLTLDNVHYTGGGNLLYVGTPNYGVLNLRVKGRNTCKATAAVKSISVTGEDTILNITGEGKTENELIFTESSNVPDIKEKVIETANDIIIGKNVKLTIDRKNTNGISTNTDLFIFGGHTKITAHNFGIRANGKTLFSGGDVEISVPGGNAVYGVLYDNDNYKIDFGLEYPHKNYSYSDEGWTVVPDAILKENSVDGTERFSEQLAIVPIYNITCDPKGGVMPPGTPATYTLMDDDIKLGTPVREGYDFTGWTGTDLTGLTKNVTIPKGSTGDRTYTANWESNKKPEPTDELKVTLKKTSSTYNGKTPKIEVKRISYGGKKVSLKAKDYKLTYSPKTVKKAGEYTVTLTVKSGTYKGKKGTATYTIKKAANPLTVKRIKKTITVKASDIKAKPKTYKIKKVARITKQQGKISYELLPGSSDKVLFNITNGSITVPKELPKGKYKVKFRVTAAGNTNYKAKSVSLTQTIQVK